MPRKRPDLPVRSRARSAALSRAQGAVGVDPVFLRGVEQEPPARLVPGLGPRVDGPVRQRQRRVRHDERLVVLQHGAEPVARGAGAAGVVEREERRRRRAGGRVALAAARVLREPEAAGVVDHDRDPFPLLEGGGDRLDQPVRRAPARLQPVHHDQEVGHRREVGVGLERLEVHRLPAGQQPEEAEGPQVLHDGRVTVPGRGREGKTDLVAAGAERLDGRRGPLGRVLPDRAAASPAVGGARPGPQEAEVVVHLGGRPHRRPAGHRGVVLLDGDGGGDAVEPVHQRLGHPVEELLRVGGQRFRVAALPLGVEGVERQRTLPGAGGTGHDDQRPARKVDGHTLEVVLAGVHDSDDVLRHAKR